jgi:hypothetical protein
MRSPPLAQVKEGKLIRLVSIKKKRKWQSVDIAPLSCSANFGAPSIQTDIEMNHNIIHYVNHSIVN